MKSESVVIFMIIILIGFILYKTSKSEFLKNYYMTYTNKKTLVFFYADWCGYCQKFWPTWKVFKETQKNINCIEIPDNQANKYSVKSFPTIRLYNTRVTPLNNDFIEYRGDRSLDSLNKFII